jgi:hypothetical protein
MAEAPRSRDECTPIPAQPASAMTGLSRRRSGFESRRSRRKLPANRHLLLPIRLKRPPASFDPVEIPRRLQKWPICRRFFGIAAGSTTGAGRRYGPLADLAGSLSSKEQIAPRGGIATVNARLLLLLRRRFKSPDAVAPKSQRDWQDGLRRSASPSAPAGSARPQRMLQDLKVHQPAMQRQATVNRQVGARYIAR